MMLYGMYEIAESVSNTKSAAHSVLITIPPTSQYYSAIQEITTRLDNLEISIKNSIDEAEMDMEELTDY